MVQVSEHKSPTSFWRLKMKNPFGTVRKSLQAYTGLFAIRDEEGFRLAEDLTEIKADFLVAAINNRENLVGACKTVLKIIHDPTNEKKMWIVDVENTLNAALAAAKEK